MSPHDRADVGAALRVTASDLLAYFERRVDCREDAADLLGETMLQAWRRADACPGEPERQRMWLFTIATHVMANNRRSRRRRSALAARLRVLLTEDPGGGDDVADAQAVRDAVMRLPFTHRELVMLIHWEQFNTQEAAEVLGINPSTARSRYAAARVALREALSEGEVDGARKRDFGTSEFSASRRSAGDVA